MNQIYPWLYKRRHPFFSDAFSSFSGEKILAKLYFVFGKTKFRSAISYIKKSEKGRQVFFFIIKWEKVDKSGEKWKNCG